MRIGGQQSLKDSYKNNYRPLRRSSATFLKEKKMTRQRKYSAPRYPELLNPVFRALKEFDGSATVSEIHDNVLEQLKLPKKVVEELHCNSNLSELDYQLAWARTYLRKYGAIESSSRGVWSIAQGYMDVPEIDAREVERVVRGFAKKTFETAEDSENKTNNNPP